MTAPHVSRGAADGSEGGSRARPIIPISASPFHDERFDARVRRTDDDTCWEWQAWLGTKGYGAFYYRGRYVRAHRYSWVRAFGQIPAGLFVCHRCDNPRCVRPDHLFLGDARANNVDAAVKGRNRNSNSKLTHCVKGHPLAGENIRTRILPDTPWRSRRTCRTCERAKKARYRAQRSAQRTSP